MLRKVQREEDDPDAGDEVPVDELSELGYQLVLFGVVGLVRAVMSLIDVYTDLKERGVVDVDELDQGYARVLELVDAPRYYDIEASELQRGGMGSEPS